MDDAPPEPEAAFPNASKFRLALAFQVIRSKPATLSIREYIQLLQSHITSSSRENGDLYLDAVGFWRTRAEESEKTRLQLEGELGHLESTTPVGPKKRKQKTAVVAAKDEAKVAEWQSLEGGGGGKVVNYLKILCFVSEPQLVVAAIEGVSNVLIGELEDQWAAGGVAKVLGLQLGRLNELLSSSQRTDCVVAMVQLLMAVLRHIQTTSSAVLLGKRVADTRMGLTKAVVDFFVGMSYQKEVEIHVLSGFYYGFLGMLRVGVMASEAGLEEALVAEEVGWYFLEVLEETWGIYRRHCRANRFDEKGRDGLKGVLKKRGFGGGDGMIQLMEGAFVEGVVRIVGMDIVYDLMA